MFAAIFFVKNLNKRGGVCMSSLRIKYMYLSIVRMRYDLYLGGSG